MSPVQVNILPVNNAYHLEYARSLFDLLSEENIRVELDEREEKVGYRMRESILKKIPFTLVIGNKEVESDLVTYRKYGSDEQITVSKNEFVKFIKEEIKEKRF